MHIAICDDNVADRKQLERLLDRQGMRYVDSFGSANAILANPRQYDLFFLDMNNPDDLSVRELVAKLEEAGVCVPICLCCSKINYRIQNLPDNLFYLDKPIKASELADTIDEASRLLSKLPTPLEIRTQEETHFLLEDEIISIEKEEGGVAVYATQDRYFQIQGTVENIYYNYCERRDCFISLHKNVILNVSHISAVSTFSVTMDNSKCYRHFLQKGKLSCYLSR